MQSMQDCHRSGTLTALAAGWCLPCLKVPSCFYRQDCFVMAAMDSPEAAPLDICSSVWCSVPRRLDLFRQRRRCVRAPKPLPSVPARRRGFSVGVYHALVLNIRNVYRKSTKTLTAPSQTTRCRRGMYAARWEAGNRIWTLWTNPPALRMTWNCVTACPTA